jgi:hypothetical protein
MVDGTIDASDPEFVRLKAAKAKKQADQSTIQASLEVPTGRVYDEFKVKIQDTEHQLRFKRFTHGTADLLVGLSFYDKLITEPVVLTDEEMQRLLVVKKRMCLEAILDRDKWRPLLDIPKVLAMVYNVIAVVSGLSPETDKGLEDFFDSDRGYAYGLLWFHEMHMTPSQVANLPESDVKAVQIWAGKWADRVPRA